MATAKLFTAVYGLNPDKIAPKPPYSLPENLPPIYVTEITTEITQPLPPQAAVETEPMDSRCGDGRLVYPKHLDPAIRELIGKRLMAECPGDAQAILDVMANAFQSKGVSNPVSYLNSLIERAKRGAFDPLPGLIVAQAREEQERQRVRRLEAERQVLESAAKFESGAVNPAPDGYKSAGAATFFANYRSNRQTIIAPTVATNSSTDARKASTLAQQQPLTRKHPAPLLSTGGGKLVLRGRGR